IYSFNNKGLPFKLSNQLSKIGNNRKWHIMCHELWIGINKAEPLKNKAIGYVQKEIIKSLIKKLKIDVITTQSHLYLNELKKIVESPKHLPLHGNIPLIKSIENQSTKSKDER